MKVENVVGWLKGLNGTGNIFEVSSNGGYALAMIWQDGKFHYQPIESVKDQVLKGTAAITGQRVSYLKESDLTRSIDGSLLIDNPNGWERLKADQSTPVVVPDSETDTEDSETIILPVSFKLTGNIEFSIGGLTKFLSILSS